MSDQAKRPGAERDRKLAALSERIDKVLKECEIGKGKGRPAPA